MADILEGSFHLLDLLYGLYLLANCLDLPCRLYFSGPS
jgi:hypothetical protein